MARRSLVFRAMAQRVSIRFERGTIVVDGDGALVSQLPGVLEDLRSRSFRAAGYRLEEIRRAARTSGFEIDETVTSSWMPRTAPLAALGLRAYQEQALAAWGALGRRGIVVLPTGAGKTRVAIATILETGLPSAVLCPTRALAAMWIEELGKWLPSPIGLVGDGERRVERVTVLTFESAYRHMDALGDRFGLLVVDEVHHFGHGIRVEALEASCAEARLGLTATAPAAGSPELATLARLVGPIAFEMGFEALVGRHLAEVTVLRMMVRFSDEERAEYERRMRLFRELRRTFARLHPGADYGALVRNLSRTTEGRRALRDHAVALELAAFPRAKRRLVTDLLSRHRDDRSIVFTALAENAYALARENLVPVIAAETTVRERNDVLRRFRSGDLRAIASARVLNEGIDVPDARVAIIVAGALGGREHVQRIGRVLRPAPGKRALVYELVTTDSVDERRAQARQRYVPGPPSQF